MRTAGVDLRWMNLHHERQVLRVVMGQTWQLVSPHRRCDSNPFVKIVKLKSTVLVWLELKVII